VHKYLAFYPAQIMKDSVKYLTLSFALLGLVRINPSFADGLYGAKTSCTTEWQTSNWTMDTVPQEFNRYYGLVGLPAQPPMLDLFYNRFKFSKAKSEFFPLNDGPYHENTLIEVEYTEDHRSVLRFRFVEKNGDDIKCGAYSAWQIDNFHPKESNGNLDQLYITQLNYMSEKFDKQKWQHEFAINARRKKHGICCIRILL